MCFGTFPDFNEAELMKAISDYNKRERRLEVSYENVKLNRMIVAVLGIPL